MNEIATYHEPQPQAEPVFHTLPLHIETYEARLADAWQSAESIKREADGLFGPVGLDALLGFVPVVGAFYTGLTGLRLIGVAARVGAGFGTIITGVIMFIIDMIIGIFVMVGDIADAIFRSHAIYANTIQDTIRNKIIAIEHARENCNRKGYLTQEEVTQLEDVIYRGGKTQFSALGGKVVTLGIIFLILLSFVG